MTSVVSVMRFHGSSENLFKQRTYINKERDDEHDDSQFQLGILYRVEEGQL